MRILSDAMVAGRSASGQQGLYIGTADRMPMPSERYVGLTLQFTGRMREGDEDADFKPNSFYRCIATGNEGEDKAFIWAKVDPKADVIIDPELDERSTNPVRNSAIAKAVNGLKEDKTHVEVSAMKQSERIAWAIKAGDGDDDWWTFPTAKSGSVITIEKRLKEGRITAIISIDGEPTEILVPDYTVDEKLDIKSKHAIANCAVTLMQTELEAKIAALEKNIKTFIRENCVTIAPIEEGKE